MRHTLLKFVFLITSVALLGVGCIRIKATVADTGIFRSTDSGAVWQQKVFVSEEKNKTVTIGGEDITTLTFEPKNPLVLYAGTEAGGAYRTENGGDQWQQFIPAQGRVHAFAVNPKNTAVLFVALGEKIYRTTDKGKTWSIAYLETRPRITITDIAIDGFDPQKVYIALSNGDLMGSRDGGNSWAILTHTDSGILKVLIHPKDTRVITIMTQYNGLFRSTNSGKDWQSLRQSLEKYYGESLRGQALVLDPTNVQTLFYFSNAAFLRSRDGGISWDEIKLLAQPNVSPVVAAAVAPQKPEQIYYATATTFYRSRDGGKTWTTSLLPTSKRPAMILVHPTNAATIYLGITKQKK